MRFYGGFFLVFKGNLRWWQGDGGITIFSQDFSGVRFKVSHRILLLVNIVSLWNRNRFFRRLWLRFFVVGKKDSGKKKNGNSTVSLVR